MFLLLRCPIRNLFVLGTKAQFRVFGTDQNLSDDADIFGNINTSLATKARKKFSFREEKKFELTNNEEKLKPNLHDQNLSKDDNFGDSQTRNRINSSFATKANKNFSFLDAERFKLSSNYEGKLKPIYYDKENLLEYSVKEGSIEDLFKNVVEKRDKEKRPIKLLALKEKYAKLEQETFTEVVNGKLATIEEKDTDFVENVPYVQLIPYVYLGILKKLVKENRVKDAITVLETIIPKTKVQPDKVCFNLVITGCGKFGYTKKAFELYYKMKEQRVLPDAHTITSLFNACGNSPWQENGLQLATKLRNDVKESKHLLNQISYHAMIKAFGRNGDITTVCEIIDEMIREKYTITPTTFNFWLQACISDKETGFRNAILAWKKVRSLRVEPDIYSYHLLMRCMIECKAGDQRLFDDMLQANHQMQFKQRRYYGIIAEPAKKELKSPNESYPVLENPDGVYVVECLNDSKKDETKSVLPNLLGPNYQPPRDVQISDLTTSGDRLALLGGVEGMLKNMANDRVAPSVVTFTYLMKASPFNMPLQVELFKIMLLCKIKPDVAFFNVWLHKKTKKRLYNDCVQIVGLMAEHECIPDIITYGCIAASCSKVYHCKQLLKEMDNNNVVPNIIIYTSMLQTGYIHGKYTFIANLVGRIRKADVSLNNKSLRLLEDIRVAARNRLIELERVGDGDRKELSRLKHFLHEYSHSMKLLKYQQPDHPWAQFGYDLNEEKEQKLRELGIETVKIK